MAVGLIALNGESDLDEDAGEDLSKYELCTDGRQGVCCCPGVARGVLPDADSDEALWWAADEVGVGGGDIDADGGFSLSSFLSPEDGIDDMIAAGNLWKIGKEGWSEEGVEGWRRLHDVNKR